MPSDYHRKKYHERVLKGFEPCSKLEKAFSNSNTLEAIANFTFSSFPDLIGESSLSLNQCAVDYGSRIGVRDRLRRNDDWLWFCNWLIRSLYGLFV